MRTAATLVFLAGLAAAQTPPAAQTIVDQAVREAARDHRTAWILFHASW